MKELEDYFNAARKQEPPHSLPEIKAMINRMNVVENYSFFNLDNLFSNRKSFIYLSLTVSTMLLALIISLLVIKGNTDPEIFIPVSQKRMMLLVKGIDRQSKSSNVHLAYFGAKPAKAAQAIPLHMRSTLVLPEETLKLLGITITPGEVRYEGNVKGSGYVSFVVDARHHSTVIDDNQRENIREYDFYPWFLTDETGKQRVRYQFENEPPLKMTNEFFSNTMDQLVPIRVSSPQGGNVIFWFSQTEALMEILESAAKVSSHAVSIKENEESPVSTLDIQIYPTITNGDVNIAAKISKAQKLEISILNELGEVIQVPVKNQTLNEGAHSFEMDLSTAKNGLYFIRIQSDPGITTIHRIFKN